MQVLDYTTGARSTVNACSNGILSMATGNPALPGMALVKRLGKTTYLLAQSDRRSATRRQIPIYASRSGRRDRHHRL